MATWDNIPTTEVVNQTAQALTERGMQAIVVKDKQAALQWLQENIPAGATVMTGSSTTLNEIGFSDYLNSTDSPWKNVHAAISAENDDAKRNILRREAAASEYFLASANAVAQTGQIVSVDATGSRVGAFLFTAEHLILVVSTKKITPDLETAMQRVREHVFPLEDKRSQAAYGAGSGTNKWVIIEREISPGRITVLLVNERLGF